MPSAVVVAEGTSLLDWLTFVAAVIATVAAALAAFFTGRMLRRMRLEARDSTSLGLIARWNGDLLQDVKRVDDWLRKHGDDAGARPSDSDQSSLLAVSSFLTELAIAVDRSMVNEDILWHFFGPVIVDEDYYPTLRDRWIQPFQARPGAKSLFTAIEKLHERWIRRLNAESNGQTE